MSVNFEIVSSMELRVVSIDVDACEVCCKCCGSVCESWMEKLVGGFDWLKLKWNFSILTVRLIDLTHYFCLVTGQKFCVLAKKLMMIRYDVWSIKF